MSDVTDDDLPVSIQVAAAFGQLKDAAKELNLVSNELGSSISALDAAFQRLNLGITTWVKFAGGSDSDGSFWNEDLGYAKVGSTWGIALRSIAGNEYTEELDKCDEWLFGDAPRVLRLNSLDKLPELMEQLAREATSVAGKIKSKIAYAQEVARAIAPPSQQDRLKAQTRALGIPGPPPAFDAPSKIGPPPGFDPPPKSGLPPKADPPPSGRRK